MIIEWSMRLFDNDQVIVKRRKNHMAEYYKDMPELFAKHRATDIELEDWDEHFGMDAGDGDVIVEIHEPASLRGRWKVSLELTVEATSAEKLKEEKADV